MLYTRTTWQDAPSTATPINAANLNKIEQGLVDAATELGTKITGFADPNADRIVFWDDSAGAYAALTPSAPLSITTTSMTVSAASETAVGVVERATDTETQTMTDTTRYISPANLAAACTSAATASRIIRRDGFGRAQIADPSVAADIANKNYVDTAVGTRVLTPTPAAGGDKILFWDESEQAFAWLDVTVASTNGLAISGTQLATYAATSTQWGVGRLATSVEAAAMTATNRLITPANLSDASASLPTADRLVRRDAFGRAQVADPSVAADIANKNYVDTQVATKITGFADPNADRIVFWDDSVGAYAPMEVVQGASGGLQILSGTMLTTTVASTTQTGSIRTSTNAEAQTGTDTFRAVTPAALRAATDTEATAERIVRRDANGRSKVATPAAADDIANKGYVDGVAVPSQMQLIPAVGSDFSSSFWYSLTTASLRDRATAPMPILLAQTISIDQVKFNVTTLAATAGQTATIRLKKYENGAWVDVQTLATAIPLTDATGEKAVTITPVQLVAGVVYGFVVYEEQTFDATLRVTTGGLIGPGIGSANAYNSGLQVPRGANTAVVANNGIPVIRMRRSA